MVEQLIGAGIGAVTSILGARQRAKAAREAARIQAEAAARAEESYTRAGERTAGAAIAEGERSSAAIGETSETAAQATERAAREAASGMRVSTEQANELLRSIYGDAFDQLTPYREGGTQAFTQLSQLTGPGGEFNRSFKPEDLEMDPGYQFRLQEGQKALERSAAARGGLQSGGTLKALARYSQGVASDEFGKAVDRFNTDRSQRFTMLNTLAGTGLRATETGIAASENYGNRASANTVASGEYGGNMMYRGTSDAGQTRVSGTDRGSQYRLSSVADANRYRMRGDEGAIDASLQQANARAAGVTGTANAWSGALSTIGRIGQQLPWGEMTRRRPNTSGVV